MRLPIIACVLISSLAAAQPRPIVASAERGIPVEPSRISLGAPRGGSIAGLTVTARSHPGHVHLTLWLRLGTRSKEATEVTLPLAVSSAVSVTGLVLGTEVALSDEPQAARTRYEDTVRTVRDPALLEVVGDHLALRVFPLTRESTATVKIEMELPYGAPLVIEPGRVKVPMMLDLDGYVHALPVGRAVSLTEAAEERTDEDPYPSRVDATTSLLSMPVEYARPKRPIPELTSFKEHRHIPLMPTTKDLVRVSERDVASAVDANGEVLRRCLALGGTHQASLAISISSAGTVTSVQVDDLEHEDAAQCIAGQVATWKFAATPRSRTLRHALEL